MGMTSESRMDRMKRRWGVESTWRFWLIMLIFSLAGMSIVYVKEPIFNALHFPASAPWWVKVPLYILIIFPTYHVLLVFWAALLGQWSFFWEKEKKMGRWFMKPFRSNQPVMES